MTVANCPQNGRGTVCLTFDNMGPGDGHEEALAVGYPRLLDALDRHGLRATFFVEGWNGAHHGEAVRELAGRGHEVGLHGWVHERWGDLDRAVAAELLDEGIAALSSVGIRPTGFRAPGGERGPHTAALLAARGFEYDASLGEGPPVRLAERIAHVPFRWSGVDGYHYRQLEASPRELEAAWSRLLDRVIETGGFLTLIAHASISGMDDQRFAALDRVLGRAATDDRLVVVDGRSAAAAARPIG